jgi:uncharacterized protein (DUF362 family)
MKKKMDRRTFIKTGAAAVIGTTMLTGIHGAKPGKAPDIAVANGQNYFENTIKAVDMLGGMKTFVKKNATVALLINSAFRHPGSIVNPTIPLAVVKMCLDAGAKAVHCIPGPSMSYFNRSPMAEKLSKELAQLKSPGSTRTVSIPKGKFLKKAEIASAMLDCDVFIDIPIAKDHAGTGYTGTLKNLMGACPYSTNKFFHYGSNKGSGTPYEDVPFLSQCIADLNTVRKPHLSVVDATAFITTNGPYGPGKMKRLHKIVAGADHVLVDAYCCAFLGKQAGNVDMIVNAHEHGLGKMDVKKAVVKEG